ncbi:hypothetical protein RB653_002895 [Dictyostelium firmibasis]|uniref:Uncharacterized protein n=1 Tax=Dictyostelium firmibasis TaxID=79012 RepID=A0AAN7TXB2_9MYCE
MNSQFTFEFDNYLKVSQPKPIRVFLTILIGFGLLLVGEFTFFIGSEKMQIVGCSLSNNNQTGSSSNSLENCFLEGFKLTTCLNERFNTGSNYTLSFSVSMFGLKKDQISKVLIGLVILTFLFAQAVFQIMHYFNWIKRKRIQQILSEGQIFLNGNKKYEKMLTIYFFIVGLIYAALKVIWILYRNDEYSNIECGDDTYKVYYLGTVSEQAGNLITSSIGYLLFPLIYAGSWINYLSDLDFKKMTDHLSHVSMKQIKNILVLDFEIYNKIIDNAIIKKYPNDSKFKLFLRKNTFSFLTTPTSEIVEFLVPHKKSTPQDFQPMLYNENKISKLSLIDEVHNDKENNK